ncbi:VWA domain-containing protein [Marinihelvus fidelis]|uniref:VWA domain-containing protein n=1 Tax=Marinihelvus fidelis TaxID=2613842 RepID=A0A5N0TGF7_9GAMM|nr:VWA domain-containing protein [Marinihelvus fidelis]KAA9134175.1 VWA domain-containing protein [Marinihelvus fidelis]
MIAIQRTLVAIGVAAAVAACSESAPERRQAESERPEPATVTEMRAHEPDANEPSPALSGIALKPSSPADRHWPNESPPSAPPRSPEPGYHGPAQDRENYADFDDNGVVLARLQPVSTFSIDVDTGAYSNVRRFLNEGRLPPPNAVRTEELVNYFSYDYPAEPRPGEPFSLATELGASPWHEGRHLLQVGLRANEPGGGDVPASNLVFLVDVSGSMDSPDKLGLLKTALKMLSRQLDADDRVSIVVYAGASGVVLEPTAGNDTGAIERALDQLQAGGGTNGAAGIELAYRLARQAFIDGGINRILLATDGDFNVGMTDFESLKQRVSRERESGVSLTTLGFGRGNYNDHLMEQLADSGDGNHAYIDTLNEARKVLVDEMSSTLQTVARDVKIQVEFNPRVVREYRLVGYENRALAAEDFNNDRVDAGEIGAGHTVTALYELSLVNGGTPAVDPLRYGQQGMPAPLNSEFDDELAFVKLRYKAPGEDRSVLMSRPVFSRDRVEDPADHSEDFRFAVAVAGFSQLLRNNTAIADFDFDGVLALATPARGADPFGYRSEFLNLVRTAQVLSQR